MGGPTRGLMAPIRPKGPLRGTWGKAPWSDFGPKSGWQDAPAPWSAFLQRSFFAPGPHLNRKAAVNRPDATAEKPGCSCDSGITCAGCQAKVQRRATMSTPADRDEREADEIATAVTEEASVNDAADDADDLTESIEPVEPIIDGGDPDPPGARFSEESGSEPMTVKAKSSGREHSPDGEHSAVDDAVDSLREGGVPLAAHDRQFFEPRFGVDFSRVRVHTDARAASAADAIGAHAFTSGSHVAFASGQFSPATAAGRTLIAHELAHVVQQSARPGTIAVARQKAKANAKGKTKQGETPCPRKPPGAAAIIALDVDVGSGTMRMTWSRAKGKGTIEISRPVTIGAGVCGTNCNDTGQSTAPGSRCTPKDDFTIGPKTPKMTHHPDAKWVSWLDIGRGIAIHFWPSRPSHPASNGCVRSDMTAALQVYCYAAAGTPVHIHGTWHPGPDCYEPGKESPRLIKRPKPSGSGTTTPASTPPPAAGEPQA